MALRIPWDIEEAVLMLDMLLKSLDGKLTRKEAVRQVSEKLRRRAVNRGIEIDDVFRNVNGITFQMLALEASYTGINTGLKQPTKLFVKTVELYRNHRELYEKKLKEAEKEVDSKSEQAEFWSSLSIQMPTKKTKTKPSHIRYKELLGKYFPTGFRIESSLDMKKFRRYYQEQYGTELSSEDYLICQEVRSVTILYGKKAYLPDSMLSQEKKDKLLQYIEDKFSSGCDAIYYGALFSEFEEVLQGERIYTSEMLKTYLSYINKGNYVLQRSYLAKDYTVQMNPEDDIREYLKEAAGPVEVERLAAELSYIPEQKIKFALSTNNDFIWNATGEYFYEDCVHFSNSELEWISKFLVDSIEERDFVTGNELFEAVHAHFPEIIEMYQWITPLGMRKVIAYKLNDKFSFNGNIISKYGEDLSMAEVYAKYCLEHSRFTLDELNVLKKELDSTIYFDEIYANSLRISQNEFVSQDMAQFDVEATDEAIGRICTGQYMSLREIRDFGTFPYAGYPWNEYLLEHFVANYSQKFMLLHIGYSANVCAGAIVKQASSFKDFNDLLVDILANSNIVLNEDSALEYLRQQGYIARRRFSDIGRIVTEAKVVRSKKG